ncbi:MAG: recombinase family protein [Candidatus Moranbacteria bacterium]|nr:recombinase family protein [Candidatus Moranbacteria bacterium]
MKRELKKRGVDMIDGHGVIQPSKNLLEDLGLEYPWSRSSPSEIAEIFVATAAKNEVSTILLRLVGEEIRLVRQGYQVRNAQDGYVNKKIYVEGKKRTIQVADSDRAKYYVAMFEMRASGQLTDKEIVEQINAMGYRTKKHNHWSADKQKVIGERGGNMLTVKKLQYHLRKPIYCGVIVEKWTNYQPVRAAYPGLVSIEKFNTANRGNVFIRETGETIDVLYDSFPEKLAYKRMRNNPMFPYKFFLCPHCRRSFLGSSPRGKSGKKFPTYHCARKHRYFGINKEDFDSTIESFIKGLHFQPEVLASLHAVLLDRYRERQSEIMEIASDVSHNVADLEAQKAQAVRAFIATNNLALKESIEEEIERLDRQMRAAQKERNKMEVTERDIDDFIKEAKGIMEQPAKMLLNPTNIQQQQALFGLVFEEMPTYDEILNGTPKLTWIFKLSEGFMDTQSQLVAPRGVEPLLPG